MGAMVALAEFCYNTTPHMSTKMTPFQALYGRSPPPLVRVGHNTTMVDSLEQMLRERDTVLDDLRANMIRSQRKMKKAADNKRRDEQFNVGEMVFLKLQPYRQRTLAK